MASDSCKIETARLEAALADGWMEAVMGWYIEQNRKNRKKGEKEMKNDLNDQGSPIRDEYGPSFPTRNAPGTETRALEIPDEFNTLEKQVVSLDEEVEMLIARIRPVRQEQGRGVTDVKIENGRDPTCEIAGRLRKISNLIQKIRDGVNQQFDLLEI